MRRRRLEMILSMPSGAAMVFSAGLLAAPFCQPARAGDVAYGEYLASECVTCHRLSGAASGIPSITGWPEEQFMAIMTAYKYKALDNEVMQTIAGRLSEDEIKALAAYFGGLGKPAAPGTPETCANRGGEKADSAC